MGFDVELLDLLWVLEHTMDLWPKLAQTLHGIMASDLFGAGEVPEPTDIARGAKFILCYLTAAHRRYHQAQIIDKHYNVNKNKEFKNYYNWATLFLPEKY